VSAVCSQGKQLKNLAYGCKVVRVPPQILCTHKRLFWRAAIPDVFGFYRPNCHHGCVMNEWISIHNRVCGEVPEPTPQGLRSLAKTADYIARKLGVHETRPLDELPLHYFGSKRTKYQQTVEDLKVYPAVPKDSHIKAFIKAEKTNYGAKENPDPRMIQARSMRYNCCVAQYLKPIEESIYRRWKSDYTNLPMVGKCLNQYERATLLQKKLEHFKNPVIVSLDASRFDQHVSREQLELEHRVYRRCNRDPEFARLLYQQLDNTCFTSNGIKYKTRGKRMSGDMNTACGNCLVMLMMVITVMRKLGIHKWDALDDGDDCLLIFEKHHLKLFQSRCDALFLSFGHEIKVENIAYHINDVEWCQCKPIEYLPGKWKFSRKFDKVVSTTLTGVKHWSQSESHRRAYVNTLGQCELILSLGVPILQEFGIALMRNAATEELVAIEENDSVTYRTFRELRQFNLRAISKIKPKPVSIEARISFERAFGIPIELQETYERMLRQWTFSLDRVISFGQEWTSEGGWHAECVPQYEVSLAQGDDQ